MNRRQYILFLILVFLQAATVVRAQDNSSIRQLYAEAENDYEIGRLNHALEILQSNLSQFKGNLRQNAYRLISLCYLAQDSLVQTEAYASKLLTLNPHYSSVNDPARFEDILMRLKTSEMLTVTTASNQEEQLTETPVPMTVITREMIDMLSNNKDLNSILAAYVPGMSQISNYGMNNVAMHGVYTSGQEKILVMENGHRLNAHSNNLAKLDYSISTEKIDHIEVLRGPASSLYGNVALTGVVNIITKKGIAVNGFKAKYGIGTYGTHKLDLVGGTSFLGADMLAWASLYTSQGKRSDMSQTPIMSSVKPMGYSYMGRYEGKPSFDWGCTLQIGDFNLMFINRYGKQVPPYSFYGEVYDYDKYRQYNSYSPGLSVSETHIELGYNNNWGRMNLNVSAYGDVFDFHDYSVVSDSIMNVVFNSDGSVARDQEGKPIQKLYHGLSQSVFWEEFTLGGLAQFCTSYDIGNMKGNFLAGAQFEHFTLSDTYSNIGEDYDKVSLVLPESKNYIKTGSENSLSFFVQDKHFITPCLIVNAGLRYDIKNRVNSQRVTALSPRVALVFRPKESLSVKLSYARSFVDAPYFYRQNSSNSYRGSENLMPEFNNALQLDVIGTLDQFHLVYDVNVFYNHLYDIINNIQSTQISSVKYRNSGKLRTLGVEGSLKYNYRALMANVSMTYQRPLRAVDYYYDNHYIYAVPVVYGNINLSYRLVNRQKFRLWLTSHVQASGQTLEVVSKNRDLEYYDGKVLADIGARLHIGRIINLSADVENLFNTNNYVGGTTYFPYQRLGRTFMASVSFQL